MTATTRCKHCGAGIVDLSDLGAGYYRQPEDALALVDVDTLVKVIPLPAP